ncbi:MAG: FAD-dependent oxidoreductase, partial [Clostridiales bacterium]|nr:FAD-dependent oxidoreductase [Clostridiales bacterium]
MKEITHDADFCVVGGGLAGMCAAIAAARRGARTVLMHDRPVPGGNASSEIRMHICGADRGDALGLRETGILEELELENKFRNPQCSYSLWDSVLFGAVSTQPNLTTLLNCSCVEARTDGGRVLSVRGWQGTAETWHTVRAALFADCSGDSVLGPLTGAQLRTGRESREEFGESIEPDNADSRTMGMSCLIQVREHEHPVPFRAPSWAANVAGLEGLHVPQRRHDMRGGTNYWWLELGGEEDPIHDTESLRDRLVPLALGVWDHIKNGGDHGADNWSLEWMGFLPGK